MTREDRPLLESSGLGVLSALGEEIGRPGLKETPSRFARAMLAALHYRTDDELKEQMTIFSDGAEKCDEMVVQRGITFYSFCEHHILPFFGTVDIGYIPNGRIIGLSKFVRIVRHFAGRLQVQERLTTDIAHFLNRALMWDKPIPGMERVTSKIVPVGVGVVVRARHLCMEMRGVREFGAETTTSCLLGAMKKDGRARQEFMGLSA